MKEKTKQTCFSILVYFFMPIVFFPLTGCTALGPQRVKPGDIALTDYTCRLKNGKVVLTTDERTAADKPSRAAVFLPYKKYGPEDITAAGPDKVPRFGKLKVFEREAVYQIGRALPGLKLGVYHTITIRSETPEGLTDEDRFTTLGKAVRKEKENKVALRPLREKLGRDPVPGDEVFSFQGFTGTIRSMGDQDAVIRVSVKDGMTVDQPFGKGIVRDNGASYDIITQAEEGHMVRTTNLLGRIISVAEDKFTIDYGNAFAGEELVCDVCVQSVQPGNRKETSPAAKGDAK
ncbi:hypothetical protein EG829_12730 [bacterium]|nr:hypothetical protein [bacterium]